jgi:hypothetical protein
VLVDNMCHLLLLKAYRSLLIYGSALYGSVTSQIEESKGQLFWSQQILCGCQCMSMNFCRVFFAVHECITNIVSL